MTTALFDECKSDISLVKQKVQQKIDAKRKYIEKLENELVELVEIGSGSGSGSGSAHNQKIQNRENWITRCIDEIGKLEALLNSPSLY